MPTETEEELTPIEEQHFDVNPDDFVPIFDLSEDKDQHLDDITNENHDEDNHHKL
jgi:hypothetical protein